MIALATIVTALLAEEASRGTSTPSDDFLDWCDGIYNRIVEWFVATHPEDSWDDYLNDTPWIVIERDMGDITGLSVLGRGAWRVALAVPGGGVLKIDLSGRYDEGNLGEIGLWSEVSGDAWWRERLVPVVAWGSNGGWLLMPQVKVQRPPLLPWSLYNLLLRDLQGRRDYDVTGDFSADNVGLHGGKLKLLDYAAWWRGGDP